MAKANLNNKIIAYIFYDALMNEVACSELIATMDMEYLSEAREKKVYDVIQSHYTNKGDYPSYQNLIDHFSVYDSDDLCLSYLRALPDLSDMYKNRDDAWGVYRDFVKLRSITVESSRYVSEINEADGKDKLNKALEHYERLGKILHPETSVSESQGLLAGLGEVLSSRSDKKGFYIPTGVEKFDNHVRGGVYPGESLLMIARSGTGKTTFLLNMSFQCMMRGKDVIHFQAEGLPENTQDRFLAMMSNIEVEKIASYSHEDLNERIKKNMELRGIAKRGDVHIISFNGLKNQPYMHECEHKIMTLSKKTDQQ